MKMSIVQLLHKYDFVPKNKRVFTNKPVMYDNLLTHETEEGYNGFNKLMDLVYDLGLVTGCIGSTFELEQKLNEIMDNKGKNI